TGFTDLTFQAPVGGLSLAAPDESTILAHVGPEQDLPLLRPGDEVHVSWAPEASLVLPAADIPTTEDLEDMLHHAEPLAAVGSLPLANSTERHSRHPLPRFRRNCSPPNLPPSGQPGIAPPLHRR